MADIELVIKIPEETCRRIQALVRDDYFEHDICGNSMRRIANGIPLPKGHGDLIDINEITAFKELECNGHNVESLDEFTVIIEADKED